MKNVELSLKKKLDLGKIEELLEGLGWTKSDPKHPRRRHDYYGLSAGGGKTIIHINEKRKTDKDVKKAAEFLLFKSSPKLKHDEFTFQPSYKKARTINQKLDVIAQWVGLKKIPIGYFRKVYLGRDKLTLLEFELIRQGLNSFGVPFRTVLVEGNLEIFFFEDLPEDWKKLIPHLVNWWWDKKPVEVNFDYDFKDPKLLYKKYLKPLAKEYGEKNIQVRKSPHGNYHARIINKSFLPKKSLEIRKKYGDSPDRVKNTAHLFKRGFRCNFLYDWKWGKPAGKWLLLKRWLRENKIK